MKYFKWLGLKAFWCKEVEDIIAVQFGNEIESYAVQDPKTPAFLRKAFGLKLEAF